MHEPHPVLPFCQTRFFVKFADPSRQTISSFALLSRGRWPRFPPGHCHGAFSIRVAASRRVAAYHALRHSEHHPKRPHLGPIPIRIWFFRSSTTPCDHRQGWEHLRCMVSFDSRLSPAQPILLRRHLRPLVIRESYSEITPNFSICRSGCRTSQVSSSSS